MVWHNRACSTIICGDQRLLPRPQDWFLFILREQWSSPSVHHCTDWCCILNLCYATARLKLQLFLSSVWSNDWKLQVWGFKSLVSLVKRGNPPPLVTCWRLHRPTLRQRHHLEHGPTALRKATNLIRLRRNLCVLVPEFPGGAERRLGHAPPLSSLPNPDHIPTALSTLLPCIPEGHQPSSRSLNQSCPFLS
ncbi:hypothetical protein SRHO_G00108820 [Serrasalmus rhombeus]